jgi:hypothetical protein
LGNDDYPFTKFKGSGFWKYKAPKADEPPKDDGDKKEEPEAPEKPCVLRDGFKPWPMCPQGPLPVNGMNGDIVNKVKDGPFLDRPKNATKAASGKKAAETSP